MNADNDEKSSLENELQQALVNEELDVYYQPQIALSDGRLIGMEALLRWQHPNRGLLMASTLVPLAEESGLVVPVGRWVLHRACKQIVEWQSLTQQNLQLCVNLSAREFLQSDLMPGIEQTLKRSGLQPSLLQLEVTENLLMQDVARTIDTLHKLAAIGVQISVDDFGTGYSCLRYLRRLPIARLKIDRSIVRHAAEDTDDRAIVAAVIALAGELNMAVIAEGVETAAQLGVLRDAGCEAMQGYFLSRPLPASEVTAFLRDYSPAKPIARESGILD